MNFQTKLWNNFELINNNFTQKRKNFKEFINMMNEKYKYDIDYAKGMRKIYDNNNSTTTEGTLGEGIKTTRNFFFNLSTYYNELTSNFKSEIIDPAKSFLDEQSSIGKKIYNDIKKLDKDYKESLSSLDKSKQKFLQSARNAENLKFEAEMAKTTYIPQQEKDKFIYKSNVALKEAKDCEKHYISNLNSTNEIRMAYVEGSKNVLLSYQVLEEEFIEFHKNILRKFFIFTKAALKNSSYDTEKGFEKIEIVDFFTDIKKFIEENQTHLSPPSDIEYVPYTIHMQTKSIEEINYPIEVIYNVICTMQGLFQKVNNEYFDPVEEKKKLQILEISKIACKGTNYTREHQKLLMEFLKEKKFRLSFLSYLNRYRTNGIFEITRNSYHIIGDILIQILNEVMNEDIKDYESAKYCIILSQTYHYINDKSEKISLQDKIESHEILKKSEFWENFIAYSIFQEIERQNTMNSSDNESEEDKNTRISNIVFSQLLPITDNMLSFEVEKENIKEVILAFSKQYCIPNELNQHLITMVEEKVYLPKQKNEELEGSIEFKSGSLSSSPVKLPIKFEQQVKLDSSPLNHYLNPEVIEILHEENDIKHDSNYVDDF